MSILKFDYKQKDINTVIHPVLSGLSKAFNEAMSFSQLPPELVSDIICHLVQLDLWTYEAMQYRSVNRRYGPIFTSFH